MKEINMNAAERVLEGSSQWRLLENGEEFFPAVFAAIETAQQEVLLETFILFEDKVGLALHEVLLHAAQRGVHIRITIDGFGSPTLSENFVSALTQAGVQIQVFEPPRLSRHLRPFRRLHRKVVVVDDAMGFIGGINFSADHLADSGPEAKQDYAVQVCGPVVHQMRTLILSNAQVRRWRGAREKIAYVPSDVHMQLVMRDNFRHRDDIERHYRHALHASRQEIIIANAYFFPGFRLLRAIRRAAKRGVHVRLILQGCSDVPIATFAARLLYDHLLNAGVQIYECCEREMHGKVALVDERWATIGSSNLDPLSLSLNLEANLVIRDEAFNAALRERLMRLLHASCKPTRASPRRVRLWRLGLAYLAFHVLRHFPRWAQVLPAQTPRVAPVAQTAVVSAAAPEAVQPWDWRSAVQSTSSALLLEGLHTKQSEQKKDDADHQKNKEQHFGDTCCARGQAGEAKQTGHQRNHRENQSPLQHDVSP